MEMKQKIFKIFREIVITGKWDAVGCTQSDAEDRIECWICKMEQQEAHIDGPVLDDLILSDLEISGAIENEKVVNKTFKIYNVDRAVCGRVAGAIAKKYGDTSFVGS